jgi:serine/threonine-protein kinase
MTWQTGDTIKNGTYTIETVISEGSTKRVYLAQTLDGKRVALKIPLEELAGMPQYQTLIQKFAKEGENLKKFHNANIIRVLDVFTEKVNNADIQCIVEEYIAGETLELKAQKTPLTETEALKCIREIGSALKYLHDCNQVHRDVHPGNILINENGTAILIDFGMMTNLAMQAGTYQHFVNEYYTPPEQSFGEARQTIDVYALAAVLYFALTGKRPPRTSKRMNDSSLFRPQDDSELRAKVNKKTIDAIIDGMALKVEDRTDSIQHWLNILPIEPVLIKTTTAPIPNPNTDSLGNLKTVEAFRSAVLKTIPWGNPLKRRKYPIAWMTWSGTIFFILGVIMVQASIPRALVLGSWVLAVAYGAIAFGSWTSTYLLTITSLYLLGAIYAIGALLVSLGEWWGIALAIFWGLLQGAIGYGLWRFHRLVFKAWQSWQDSCELARNDLFQGFSRFHSFLVLASCNLFCLWLGRILYKFVS